MIDFSNVTAFQQQHRVLDNFSLKIGNGEKVAILGPNGAGKSTILKLMTREIYPVEREGSHLKLFGSDKVNLWDLRSRIGFISQDLQEDYTPSTGALDVVISGFFGAIGSHGHLQPTADQVDQARSLLAAVEMADFEQIMFQRLSTGQKRRLLLARALVHKPSALILDEPSNGLDMGASLGMLKLMRSFCAADHAMVITTHHIDEIIPEIERVVLLKKGEIMADGPTEEVISSESLSELYDTKLRIAKEDGWYRCWHA